MGSLHAQRKPLGKTQKPNRTISDPDSIPPFGKKNDDSTINMAGDSINNLPDQVIDIKYSDDPLEAQLDYTAEDSMMFDVINDKIYLWGRATVKYEKMELTAGHIVFDQKNDLVIAEGMPDSLGRMSSFPEFSDGEQSFKAKKMKYNFKSKKGVIFEVTTQENDLYIHSERGVFQSFDGKDSLHPHEDVIYTENSLFTTCDHDEPHFGIRSRKQKVIANKIIVVGPSNLEIAGVSTPLWMPFGFFPVKKGQRSGLIFPRDYENSQDLGFGLRNVGYYWGINDNYDFQLTGDIYTRGTWRLYSQFRYNIKYKYQGALKLTYAWNNLGDGRFQDNLLKKDIQKTFKINWSMNQSAKSHPTRNFTALVDFQINDAQRLNNNTIDNVLDNSLSSNINYKQSFPGKPISLTASINHSQNTNTNDITIKVPNLRFTMQRIYPFKQKNRVGKEKWFEKVGINYSLETLGQIQTKDTLLFEKETWDDFNYGFRHKTSLESPIRFLKNFSFNPNVNYSETWFLETARKEYQISIDTIENKEVSNINPLDTITTITYDTLGTTETFDKSGFKSLRQFNAGFNISTDVYSTLLFKKGRVKGIRWTMKPSVGFSYTPDYTNERWGYFDTYSRGHSDNIEDVRYSVFEGNVFGQNPSTQGKQMNITYGLQNFFEAKVFSRKDSINPIKRVKLFDNISLNGDYNFARDSLKFSMIRANGTARFLKNISTLTLTATFDPYIENNEGVRLNTSRWKAEKRILRFDQLSMRLSNRVSWNQIQEWFNIGKNKNDGSGKKSSSPKSNNANTGRDGFNNQVQDTNYSSSFISDFSFEHLMNINFTPDTVIITSNTLSLRTTINLSDKWQFVIRGIGYDFRNKSLTYPDVAIARDLHCWRMSMSWQPTRGTYTFSLKVNPGSLEFISVPWTKNQFDSGLDRF